MKISPVINNYYYNNKPYIQNNTAKNSAEHNHSCKTLPSDKTSYIYFTRLISPKSTQFLQSTINTANELYKKYENNLMEVSLEEVSQIAAELKNETLKPEKEILESMSHVTQFSGISSLKTIGQVLKKENIGSIGNMDKWFKEKQESNIFPISMEVNKFVHNDKGLHGTLSYLLNNKKITPLNEYKNNVAIFIDNSKLKQLEELRENDKTAYEFMINHPNIKFFVLSGWDSGVTFLDRTKSIKEAAKNLLNSNNSDNILLKKINNLGIKPIVITNKPAPTTEAIYQNMAPLKMTKNDLYTIIDANTQERISGEKNLLIGKDMAANYLNEALNVYSPEKMSYALKNFHQKILKYAKETEGKTEKDIIYYIPALDKSYSYVNYSYQKINNIPDECFKTRQELKIDNTCIKNKMVVILDDCSISGSSLASIIKEHNREYCQADCILFACLDGTSAAKEKFYDFCPNENTNIMFYRENKPYDFYKKYSLNDIGILIGDSGYCNGEYCYVFPYMSPDNNSELGSNIALLHNVNYKNNNTTEYLNALNSAIKTSSTRIIDINKTRESLQKLNFDYELSTNKEINMDLNKLSKMEMWKKYKEYLSELESKGIYN